MKVILLKDVQGTGKKDQIGPVGAEKLQGAVHGHAPVYGMKVRAYGGFYPQGRGDGKGSDFQGCFYLMGSFCSV